MEAQASNSLCESCLSSPVQVKVDFEDGKSFWVCRECASARMERIGAQQALFQLLDGR